MDVKESTVFISSTSRESDVRRQVARRLEERRACRILSQDSSFYANPAPPEESCRSQVARCDLFVGIIGHFRGSSADAERSYVELECEVARALGKPRLIFLAADELTDGTAFQEPRHVQAQRRFRDALRASGVTVEPFASWQELPEKVDRAVAAWLRDRDALDAVVPPPPEPYSNSPCAAFSTFCGREAQRAELTRWFTSRDETVCVLIGGAGMGKSSLAWMWMHQDVLGTPPPNLSKSATTVGGELAVPVEARPAGVLRWSFDDDSRLMADDVPFVAFLRHALHYVTRSAEARDLSPAGCLGRLVHALRRQRFLLVLDGFERELNALGAKYGADGRGSSDRDCVEALARNFLGALVAAPLPSRVLICSRVSPRALEADDGDPLRLCHVHRLEGLDGAETSRLLKAHGLPESVYAVDRAAGMARRYGGNPLTLTLTIRRMKADLAASDLVDPFRYEPHALSQEAEVHRAFTRTLDSLSPDRQRILSVVAAFRSPVRPHVLAEMLPEVEPWILEGHLRDLETGTPLLTRSDQHYDMHPLLRHFVRQHTAERSAIHARAADTLAARLGVVPDESYDEPGRPGRLGAPIPDRRTLSQYAELFHHLLHCGRRTAALAIFAQRLWVPLSYSYGDIGILQDLLFEAFPRFHSPEDYLRPESHELEAFALNQLANNLRMGGAARLAVTLHRAVAERDRRVARPDLQAIRQQILGLALIFIGDHAVAEENLGEALALSERHEGEGALQDASNRTACHRDLALLHIRTGRFEAAEASLRRGRELASLAGGRARTYLSPILALHSWAVLRQGGDPAVALEWAEQAIAVNSSGSRAVVRYEAEAKVFLGLASLAGGRRQRAAEALHEALEVSQEINHRRIEIMARLGLGDLALDTNDPRRALEGASLAARFARDGGYVDLEAEGALLTAECWRRLGERDRALASAQRAEDLSRQRLDPVSGDLIDNELEPGRYDAPLRERASVLLRELRNAGTEPD